MLLFKSRPRRWVLAPGNFSSVTGIRAYHTVSVAEVQLKHDEVNLPPRPESMEGNAR